MLCFENILSSSNKEGRICSLLNEDKITDAENYVKFIKKMAGKMGAEFVH